MQRYTRVYKGTHGYARVHMGILGYTLVYMGIQLSIHGYTVEYSYLEETKRRFRTLLKKH